jgi:hypothetical protein
VFDVLSFLRVIAQNLDSVVVVFGKVHTLIIYIVYLQQVVKERVEGLYWSGLLELLAKTHVYYHRVKIVYVWILRFVYASKDLVNFFLFQFIGDCSNLGHVRLLKCDNLFDLFCLFSSNLILFKIHLMAF